MSTGITAATISAAPARTSPRTTFCSARECRWSTTASVRSRSSWLAQGTSAGATESPIRILRSPMRSEEDWIIAWPDRYQFADNSIGSTRVSMARARMACGSRPESWCIFDVRRCLAYLFSSFGPVMMVAQEVIFVPEVQRCPQEQPTYAEVPHPLETAVCGVDTTAHDFEPAPLYLAAETIVLGEADALIKPSQFAKLIQLEHHEHAGTEGPMQTGKVLEEVVGGVKNLVDEAAVAAQDVGGHTLQVFALSGLDDRADQRIRRELVIRVEKKDVLGIGEASTVVAAGRRHASRNHLNLQAIAKAHDDFGGAVGGVGVSD